MYCSLLIARFSTFIADEGIGSSASSVMSIQDGGRGRLPGEGDPLNTSDSSTESVPRQRSAEHRPPVDARNRPARKGTATVGVH